MINIPGTNLYIGTLSDLRRTDDQNWAFVHATQTVHYKIMRWDRKYNKPDKRHPNYIIYEKDNRLSLNWVDGAAHLYDWTGPKTFTRVLDFIDKWIVVKKVLIHCDQGQSRAPTLGLLYLAKRLKTIPDASFVLARNEFVKLYPDYLPSGIGDYVKFKWQQII
jgi:hypothetical protein